MITDTRSRSGCQERIIRDENGFYNWQILFDDETEWRTTFVSSTMSKFTHHYE